MKKLLSLLVVALGLVSMAQAQPFFDAVSHRGAFGTTNWAAGWSNFTPQSTVYPGDNSNNQGRNVVNFSGDISGNVTWGSNDLVIASGAVHVTSGATLTIQPGCVIRGSLTNRFSLIVSRGGQINAQGTAASPIVFTSNAAPGSRTRGDWGGVILCGNASINQYTSGGTFVGEDQYEALPADPLAEYGGGVNFNDNESSGTMRYIRIEFAGFNYLPNQEINGLTFAGCGKGTVADYIQVSFSLDDSFEWFGGTSNHKYLIAFAGTDDDFDADQGYRGNWQFLLGVRHPGIYELPGGTSNGFEHDNNTGYTGSSSSGENAPGNQDPTPRTEVLASNVTIVGPIRDNESRNDLAATVFGRGLELRTATRTSVFNSIVSGYPELIRFNNNSTVAADNSVSKMMQAGTTAIANNLLGTQFNPDVLSTSGSGANAAAGFTSNTYVNNNNTSASRVTFQFNNGYFAGDQLGNISQFNFSGRDWSLTSGSTATAGAAFTNSLFTGKMVTAGAPTASISVPTSSVCAGQSATFSSNVSNAGTNLTYQWRKNGTNISGATSASYTATGIANNDVFTLVVTNTGGSSTSNAITMTVVNNVVTEVGILNQSAPSGIVGLGTAANRFKACNNGNYTFLATPTNGGTTPTYVWKLNGTQVGTGSNYTLDGSTLTNGTNYNVTVEMTSSISCASGIATATAYQVTATNSITPSVFIRSSLTPTGTAGNPGSITENMCSNTGSQVTYTAQVTDAGQNPVFAWTRNGQTVGGNSATYTNTNVANNDIVAVTVTADIPCASGTAASNTLTLRRNNPVSAPTVTNNGPYELGATATVTITPVTANGTVSYNLTGPNSYNQTNNTGIFTIANMGNTTSGTYSARVTVPGCPQSSASTTVLGLNTDLVVNNTQSTSQGTYNTITINSTGTLNLAQNITANAIIINNGGTVNFGTFTATFTSGTFVANTGSNVIVGHAGGLNGATAGTVTRTLGSGVNYTFNGTAAQVTGAAITAARNVTINNSNGVTLSGATSVSGRLALQAGNLTAGSNLTLTSTATTQGIIDNFSTGFTGTISGTVTMQRFLEGAGGTLGANRHIASPMTNSLRALVGPCNTQQDWNENSYTWTTSPTNCGGTNTVTNGSSILRFSTGAGIVNFVGTPATGTITAPFVRSSGASTATLQRGFNALGNPYPSAINWQTVANDAANTANTNGTAFVFRNGQYATISKTGVATLGANPIIAPGQGFLVRRSTVGSGTFTFNQAMRTLITGNANNFFRAPSLSEEVRLTLTSEATPIADEVLIYSAEEAAMGEDDLDAVKLFSPEATAPSMYVNADAPMTVAAMPMLSEEGRIVPVAVQTPVAGTYNLNAAINNLPAGFQVLVEDKATGKISDIANGYSFQAAAGGVKNINLHFTRGSGGAMSQLVNVYTNGAGINVAFGTSTAADADITVLDASGRIIMQTAAQGRSLVTLPVAASSGIYLVRVAGKAGVTTNKVLYSAR